MIPLPQPLEFELVGLHHHVQSSLLVSHWWVQGSQQLSSMLWAVECGQVGHMKQKDGKPLAFFHFFCEHKIVNKDIILEKKENQNVTTKPGVGAGSRERWLSSQECYCSQECSLILQRGRVQLQEIWHQSLCFADTHACTVHMCIWVFHISVLRNTHIQNSK